MRRATGKTPILMTLTHDVFFIYTPILMCRHKLMRLFEFFTNLVFKVTLLALLFSWDLQSFEVFFCLSTYSFVGIVQ